MYIYVLFVKGIINDPKAEQPRKLTQVCHSDFEAKDAFLRYCKLEGYEDNRLNKAGMQLMEKGYTDGTFEDFMYLATLVKVDMTPKAF